MFRLPYFPHSKSFASHVHFEQNSRLDISVEKDNQIIKPTTVELQAEKPKILRYLTANFFLIFYTPKPIQSNDLATRNKTILMLPRVSGTY